MSGFKEQIAKDLDIFINADEFADWHLLNEKKIKCIVSTDESTTAQYSRGSSFDDNVFNCAAVIEYKYEDYPKAFKAFGQERVYFDNLIYTVNHFSVSDGLATLALARTA